MKDKRIGRNTMSAEKKPFQRLPADVIPLNYQIFLKPDLKTFTCEGEQSVYIDVKKSTDAVTLNSVDIDISEATFNTPDGIVVHSKDISFNTEEETVTILFSEKLPVGLSGHLHLKFQGEINDKMKGLYRSKYTGTDGVVKYAAVTQFEATDARRCFPCWDEPAHKSTFDIALQVPVGLTALSNMPVKSRTNIDTSSSYEKLIFETTPKMSTYLVAVVIGEFDYVQDETSDGVLVRVYTPINKKEQGRFALEVATKVLPYYLNYFGIPYPLPKMDLIAIADFSSGAMENWGLVTYRETCLLVDPQNTSTARKQWIALVVGHELAHQWFGNLVTMEWWDDLWLNEGYATFVEFLCVAHLFPEYDIWTQFVTDIHIKALELDALRNSHPIQVPVSHPSEIDEIFDDISYSKGASIIRMLHSYIGDDDFRKGMSLYLKRHSYANAETSDLWGALEEASSKPVRAVMSTWTKQQGFPIVSVEQRREENHPNDVVLTFKQKRFLADDGPAAAGPSEDNMWMIPLSVGTSQTLDKEAALNTTKVIMSQQTQELVVKDVPKNAWIKINPGTIGFYRTSYSADMLQLLRPAIKNRTLPPLDRLGLLDDLIAITRAGGGQASTVDVLQLMQAFQLEDNYTVWSTVINCLSKIGQLISHLDHLENSFETFGRCLLKDINRKLGWEVKRDNNNTSTESHLDTLLRPRVLGKMISLGDQETIDEAKKRFALHVSGETILPADLRSPVYRAVLMSSSTDADGENETLKTMLKLYRESDLHEEKDRILGSLGAVKDEASLAKVLEFAMSEEVRAQDTVFGIISVTTTYKGRLLAWKFLKEKWDTLLERYGGGYLMTRLIKYTAESFATEEMAREIEQFFENRSKPGAERTVQQCVETVKLNVAWLNRDGDSIEEFLTKLSVSAV